MTIRRIDLVTFDVMKYTFKMQCSSMNTSADFEISSMWTGRVLDFYPLSLGNIANQKRLNDLELPYIKKQTEKALESSWVWRLIQRLGGQPKVVNRWRINKKNQGIMPLRGKLIVNQVELPPIYLMHLIGKVRTN